MNRLLALVTCFSARVRTAVVILAITAPVVAQTVIVSAPTPLTNTRYGGSGIPAYASVATNGRTFVAAWQAGSLVRVARLNADGSAGVGVPVAAGRDTPAIAAIDTGYVVATTNPALAAEIHLVFLDDDGRPVARETPLVGYGFRPQLVTNRSLIALFYTYGGLYTAVLFDHHGNERLRRSLSSDVFLFVADFAAAANANGTSFEMIFSDGHDVYVQTLDADGNVGPMVAVQTAAWRLGLYVQVSIASSGSGYLAAWNTSDGKLNAVPISDAGSPGETAIIATPSPGLEVRRPRLAWTGTRYACAYIDGSGHDYNLIVGTPRFLEIDPSTMTPTPRSVIAEESFDVSVAAGRDRWLAVWTERRKWTHNIDTGLTGGAIRGLFIGDTPADSQAISLAATEQWMPAAVSNGTSILVTWFEATSDGTALSAGIVGSDHGWGELGAVTAIASAPQTVVAATDGSNYLVAWDTSALRFDSSGAVLDATPLLIPFAVTGAAWDGRAYVLVGASNAALVATTVPSFGPVGALRQIRSRTTTDSPFWARVASSGDGSLVTFVRAIGSFPMQATAPAAIALDRDLNPRASELALVSYSATDTAVAWNGSHYLVIICRDSTVLSSRVSLDGTLLDVTPRLIHEHVYPIRPAAPAVAVTRDGYAVAWHYLEWDRRPVFSGYVARLRDDGTPVSSGILFDRNIMSAPLLVTRADGESDIIASAFRSAVPYYGASRIDSFRLGTGASRPSPPRLTARSSNAGYVLEWTAVEGATGYRLQYRSDNGEWQEFETWFAPAQTTVTVAIQGAGPFAFRVRALGSGGPSDYSNEISLRRGTRRRAAR